MLRNLLFSVFLLLATASTAQLDIYELMERRDLKLEQIDSFAKKHFEMVGTARGSGYNQYQRWLFEQNFHLDSVGYIRNPAEESAAFQASMQTMQRNPNAGNWVEKGPTSWNRTTGWNPGVGRITSIGMSPLDTTVIYIGSPGGGIWKSANSGTSWTPLSDNASTRMNVYALAVDPTNVDVVYAGASGAFKSTDGGNTWITLIGVAGTVRKFLFHPNNSNIVFAVSSSGIFRTEDAGSSWAIVSFLSTEDIEFNPANVNIMYATGGSSSGSVQRSTDNGLNWTILGAAQGITNTGRTLVSVTPANPNIVYVCQASGSLFGRMYRSTDAGISFTTTVVGNPSTGTNYFGYETTGTGTSGQATYDMAMCASPTNADEVYIAGIICWKSLNGGSSFFPQTAWSLPNSIGYNHADVHTLDYINSTIYASSDGGIYKSKDLGDNWIDITSGLGIRQFYRIDCSQTNPEMFGGGAQDNGSSIHKAFGWIDWLGADGMEMEFSYTNENVVYGTSQNGQLYRSINGGNSYSGLSKPSNGNWVTPFAVHPTRDSIVFVGWTGVYSTTDRGNSWTNISGGAISTTLSCLAVSLSNPQYIFASAGKTMYVTPNGGTTWTSSSTFSGSITSICVHPTNPTKVWITTNSSGSERVMVSDNAGASFTSIAGSLPALGSRSIVIDKDDPNETLYVGMNTGVYYRDNTMSDWIPFLTDLPLVSINELDIQLSGRKIRAGTYGRGIWETDLLFGSPLPVRWLSFVGKKTKEGNLLNWKVEENKTTDRYELEYSSNGVRFSKIATMEAQSKLNNSSLTANYVHTDVATKDAYYRLKQFDKDGRFFYSDIVFLKDARNQQLMLYPNPVQDKLRIGIPGNFENSKAIVQVYDVNGILLLQQAEGNNNSFVNTSLFSKGQYILRVTAKDKVYQQVFIKQ